MVALWLVYIVWGTTYFAIGIAVHSFPPLWMNATRFTLAGGLERAIYRIARKHAGDQPEGWVCRLSVLHEKTGSESPLKHFAYLMKKIEIGRAHV